MEAKGIPTALVITEPFTNIVAAFAPTVGMAEYGACVAVPHRVSKMNDDELHKLAMSIVDEAVQRLTT